MQAEPLGTIKSRRCRGTTREFEKVSHHGHWRQRWQISPAVPSGPGRLAEIQRRDPTFANRFRAAQAQAVAKSNRERAMIRSAILNRRSWYVTLPRSKAIVMVPCVTRREAAGMFSEARLVSLCERECLTILTRDGRPRDVDLFEPGHPVEIVRGSTIAGESGDDGRFEGFVRLIPDERREPRTRASRCWMFDLGAVASSG